MFNKFAVLMLFLLGTTAGEIDMTGIGDKCDGKDKAACPKEGWTCARGATQTKYLLEQVQMYGCACVKEDLCGKNVILGLDILI